MDSKSPYIDEMTRLMREEGRDAAEQYALEHQTEISREMGSCLDRISVAAARVGDAFLQLRDEILAAFTLVFDSE